jgi:serine/threonine protein kinase/WD40 repeat protein
MVRALESGLLPDEAPGVRIGNYKLLQKIGEGGFGVVWMAEQQEPVRRRVALKVIKPGMDTADVIARFEAERQALALMEHPNIAQVFDAGATDAGRPYFVMELVRGVPITRYCDENRAPTEARLRLFVTVCQAVQHAHQKGIIHRDLKPSNILVTLHDGIPVPKVIDFGIAKATGQRLTEKTLVTQFHAFIGTPAYTSPEQMEMSGLDVDTRSDIYSLGVLLYELLTGRTPFESHDLVKAGFDAMRRTIREREPPRPSQRLSTLSDEDRTVVAHQRSTNAIKLSLLLRGDLDWVVMHCLEKDRTRRYETANGLAMDIRRHLESEPVVARPPSQAYRLGKFIHRHELGFAAAAAVAASVVAGLIVSSVLLVRERTAHVRAAEAEKTESQLRQEADRARKLEMKNASRTALDLAGQLLEKGQTADALAYLVYAAQEDPGNVTIAPRLASVLTAHNFLIPEGAPFECGSRVLAVHYTVDGRSIYIGTEDGTFRMIDAASGELKREIRLGKNVRRHGWAFAEKNEAVFGVSFVDKTIGLIEVKSGRPVWPPVLLDGPEVYVWDQGLKFSPDARWLYSHGETCFWVWEAATGKERIKRSFSAFYSGPEFTNDGTRLTFASQDMVQVCTLPEGKPAFTPIRIMDKYLPILGAFSFFSPDGKSLLVFGPQDLHAFDARDGTPIWSNHKCYGLDGFLPDGRMISASETSWELLDVTTGTSTSLPGRRWGVSGQDSSSADGRFLLIASSDGFPRLWEKATGRLVAEATLQQHDSFDAAPSPDGAQVVLGTGAGAVLRLRVSRGAARPLVLPTFLAPYLLPNALFDEGPARLLWFKDDHAVVLDVASGREVDGGFAYPPGDLPALQTPNTYLHARGDLKFFVLQDWTGHRPSVVWEYTPAGIRRVGVLQGDEGALPGSGYWKNAFSRTGDLFARAKGLREIGVWNLRTGAAVGPGCTYEDMRLCPVGVMDLSPDGKRLAAGTMDGKGLVWDVATGHIVTVLQLQSDTYCAFIHFSPDGERLLTVTWLKQARLWNFATGEPCSSVLNLGDPINHTGFSPDGRWIWSGDDSGIRIWDGRNGTPVSEPSTKPGRLLFSRDGERIAFADGDDVLVCDTRNAQPLSEPMHLRDPGLAAWSPDGRFLLVGVKSDRGDQMLNLLSVPPSLSEGTPIPPWLLQLASICATKKINEAGQCVDAPEVVSQIGDVRRQLAALPDGAPYVEWGRWMLDDSATRSIAPGFTITPAEADKLEAGLPSSISR